jgi:hypothetical protein
VRTAFGSAWAGQRQHPDSTFAALIASTGAADRERRWVVDVGNVPFLMEWSTALAKWFPANGFALYNTAKTEVTNSTGTQALTLPIVAHPANFFSHAAGLSFEADLWAKTSVSATGRTITATLGATNFLAMTGAAARRVGMRFGFHVDSPTAQEGWIKGDNNEFDGMNSSANSDATPMTENLATALSISGNVTFTTAAAAATARVRVNYYLRRRGG